MAQMLKYSILLKQFFDTCWLLKESATLYCQLKYRLPLYMSYHLQVVFITTLYYLLTASDAQYLPVMWISNLLPTSDDANIGGTAFTIAIRSVFAASLQIALFYGLYTWLIHTIFSMQTAILSAGKYDMNTKVYISNIKSS